MSALAVFDEALQAGLTLAADGDELVIRGKKESLERFLPTLREHKLELLSMLRQAANDEPPASPVELGYAQEDINELDALIHRFCSLVGYSDEARQRILAARKRMRPAIVQVELAYFREQVQLAENGEFRWN